jgi:hypothetical protein
MSTNKQLLIAFHIAHFDYRGTGDAIYNYAHYNETLLGNQSVIVVHDPEYTPWLSDDSIKTKFIQRFQIVYFKNVVDLTLQLKELNVDALYYISSGEDKKFAADNFPRRIPLLVHCVFDMSAPHGKVYAGISEWIAKKYNQQLYVPHMITVDEDSSDLRTELGIPADALVFGRIGGKDSFNIEFAFNAIIKAINTRNDIYFVFAPMTHRYIIHPRVIYTDVITNSFRKRRFINTCNAMIHARSEGESFGIAVLEFSKCNRPVIMYPGTDQQHILNLKKALVYTNQEQLEDYLINFESYFKKEENYDETEQFSPENVMQQFKTVFLDNI